jgi:hypothetical protein
MVLGIGEAVLDYLPHANDDRNTLIEKYFKLVYQYSEIMEFFSSFHGIQLSLQTKRLRRRKDHASVEIVSDTIQQELEGTGSCLGYRQMHQKLRIEHGIVAQRETV